MKAVLDTNVVVTEGKLTVDVITRDRTDNTFLACAREANAEYLVSGYDHLLSLKAYEGTQILDPATFLALLLK